ncbi:hypothetical protein MFIFM68171_09033 [Madurella fahalii]|uniref:Uncharacterized protein n=1 Tax=Madurella fahalii TaxID=1157608 RepID=A0ABQ0GM36_9PEZI
MAQPSVVGMTAATGTRTSMVPGGGSEAGLLASLTSDEIREIREYDKLLRFRDEVVSGSHPRIKPTHLLGKAAQSPGKLPTPAAAASSAASATSQPAATKGAVNHDRAVNNNLQAQQANRQTNMASSVPGLGTLSSPPGGPKPLGAGKHEIDPVLLEKSADLVKAEIQLKRQRLERGLKEQIEQRRAANKAPEQLPDLDVADIFAKALSMVHATPARSTDETAANASASSDSFDDNTFYSSRHDTPESNMTARLPTESEDEEMREGSPYEPELDSEPVVQTEQIQPVVLPAQPVPPSVPSQQQTQPNASASGRAPPAPEVIVPGLSIRAGGSTGTFAQPPAPLASGALESSSEESGNTGNGQPSDAQDLARVNERLLNQALARDPSPLVRAHDLSPLAPQPTHVFPPAIARQPHLATTDSSGARATPAQVAALRKQPSNGSSPESSPQGNTRNERKKNKKKKRKADRLAAEAAAASPYIKPEPRSPSPLTSPQSAHPNKRQRRSQQQPVEILDDEPRYEQRILAEESYQERYQPRVVRQERVVGYERGDDYHHQHGDEPVFVTSPRYERVYYDDYGAPPEPAGTQYVREVCAVRPGPRVVEAGPYEDGATYYRDVRAASRMSVRPAAVYPDRSQSPVMYERPPAAMPPPKRRIVVDAFGREYLEPARPTTVIREEVISDPRGSVSIPERRYERVLPPRAISRRPELLDDDAVLYRPASPAYGITRRVVTQPEYAIPDHRGGYREATSNPMPPPPPNEYHPSRPITSEREPLPSREYLARPASVRPLQPPAAVAESSSAHYENGPSGYAPPRDYYAAAAAAAGGIIRAASARPAEASGGIRYEQPALREYPPLPPPPPLRSASVRPAAETVRTAMRYDYDYGAGARAYHRDEQEGRRGEAVMPPPPSQVGGGGGGARAYSVVPPGEVPQVVRREYPPAQGQGQSGERYYGRPPPMGREDDGEVVFLDRVPRDRGYREMR